MCCQVCGISAKPVLAIHHVIPVELGGRATLANLTTLCANCHRMVHWLSTGDRAIDAHAYGLGHSPKQRQRLLVLARAIRRRRLRIVGPDLRLSTSVSVQTAMSAVIQRNGLDAAEAALMKRCFLKALRAIAPADRKVCSVRLVRQARFISVNANNHLAIRVPAWNDYRQRVEGDIILIWPQAVRPSILSASRFHEESSGGFKLIPHFNLSLTWDECLALTHKDWGVFRQACHDGLTLARTRRWTSNVVVDL